MKYLVIGLCLTLTFCNCTFGNDIFKRKVITELTCADRNIAVNDVEQRLKLTRTAFSVTTSNEIIELYTNKYKGNWLIMITGIDKITCGLIGGQQEFIFE